MDSLERILILYGSETGNCQDLSILIARRLSSLKAEIVLMACDEYPIQTLPEEKFVLFICSTTGVGEEPTNMKRFWRFLLRKDLPNDSLSEMTFAVIGLGDSSYQKYNFVAKKLFKRLLVLGGTNLLDLALGDDQHELGPFIKIDPWLREFYQSLSISVVNGKSLFDSSFCVTFNYSDNEFVEKSNLLSENLEKQCKYHSTNLYQASVIKNDRVTSEDHFQDVRLMSLQIDDTLKYKLGDVCVAYYQNSNEDVETFLNLFKDSNLSENQLFLLKVNKNRCWIPKSSHYYHLIKNRNPCTIEELVQNYMDINSIPKRSFFDLFQHFSTNDLERNMLERFASGSDLDELYDYINRPKRTILEVLADFPYTTPNVPFHYWFDLIPAISPRPYSIASSPNCDSTHLDILYAVVNYRTRIRKPRLGLCTNWLSKQEIHSPISILIRSGNFRLTKTDPSPLIMISIGTGVAPFRAFIHDRAHRNIGQNYLFFGCRYSQLDYYLREEWEQLSKRKLLQVFTAFSRESSDNKVYVQHIVWLQRELFYQLFINMNGTVLIAGKSQQYPQLVRETIVDIFKEKLSSESLKGDDDKTIQTAADNLVAKYEIQKRIQFECW